MNPFIPFLLLILSIETSAQPCGRLDLELQDVTGCPNTRSYICPGEMVQYECGNNVSTGTLWNGTATLFNCPSNGFSILPASGNIMCGDVSGTPISNTNDCFLSSVTFEATTALNGSIVHCNDGTSTPSMLIDADKMVIVGTPDAPPNIIQQSLNLTSVRVSATCPDYGCECVDGLTIHYTSSELTGSMNTTCGVPVTITDPALCLDNVSFTAQAFINRVDYGLSTDPVPHQVDISGLQPLDVTVDMLPGPDVTVSWSPPVDEECPCISYELKINNNKRQIACGQNSVQIESEELIKCANNIVSVTPRLGNPSIGLVENLSDDVNFTYVPYVFSISSNKSDCLSMNARLNLTIRLEPEPSGSGELNNNGSTIVYVNGSIEFSADEFDIDITLDDVAFGMANVTVIYEVAGSMCSFRDERVVPVCVSPPPPEEDDSSVSIGSIVGPVCGVYFGLYGGVVSGSASNMYWILPLVAGLSGSLVVLMAVGMITSIAVFPIGIVLLIAVCCCCGEKRSGNECYDSSYHNETMAKFLFYLGIVTSIIIFPLGIVAVLLYLCKYKYARSVVISFGITGAVIVFPIGLVLLFVTCCCCRGKESDDQPHMQFQDLSDCHKALVYIGGVASAIIFPLGVVIFIYHLCSKSDSKEKDDQEMKNLRSGSPPDPESPPTKEPPLTGPMYQDPSTIQHQPHPETGEMYAVVQEKKKKKKKGEEPTGVMYQDPQSIEHQQAESGDMYAMPQKEAKKKKKGKKGEEHKTEEELAQMYSTVDKDQKKKSEGLVYADLDVHSSAAKPPPSQVSEYADIKH